MSIVKRGIGQGHTGRFFRIQGHRKLVARRAIRDQRDPIEDELRRAAQIDVII